MVENARSLFRLSWDRATRDETMVVTEASTATVSPRFSAERNSTPKTDVIVRTMQKTPTFTTATAWSRALTGVGATMAAGSHACSGIRAALAKPNTKRSRRIAAVAGKTPAEQVRLLQSWGNTVLFGGYRDPAFVDAAHEAGMAVYAELGCFAGERWWTEVPASRPITAMRLVYSIL